jgi:hypothetical protein
VHIPPDSVIDFNAHEVHIPPVRPSPLRHPVAVLRQITGLRLTEFADLVGLPARLVQSIELAQRRMTGANGDRIAIATGVSRTWLFSGDVTLPPTTQNGSEFTFEAFTHWQEYTSKPANAFADYEIFASSLIELVDRVFFTLESQRGSRKSFYNALDRFEWAIDDVVREIEPEPAAWSESHIKTRSKHGRSLIEHFVSFFREVYDVSVLAGGDEAVPNSLAIKRSAKPSRRQPARAPKTSRPRKAGRRPGKS